MKSALELILGCMKLVEVDYLSTYNIVDRMVGLSGIHVGQFKLVWCDVYRASGKFNFGIMLKIFLYDVNEGSNCHFSSDEVLNFSIVSMSQTFSNVHFFTMVLLNII